MVRSIFDTNGIPYLPVSFETGGYNLLQKADFNVKCFKKSFEGNVC